MLQRIDFAKLTRVLLQSGRYTTASLGRELGVTQPSISRLANGKTRSVSADVGIGLIVLAGGRVEMPEPGGQGL